MCLLLPFHLELMYNSLSTAQDIRKEEMNRVINSACADACRTLKATMQHNNNKILYAYNIAMCV